MFNLKEGTKFNITYFAKKYGKFITRAGVWTEQSKQWISKKNESLFTYYDLDNEGYLLKNAKQDQSLQKFQARFAMVVMHSKVVTYFQMYKKLSTSD